MHRDFELSVLFKQDAWQRCMWCKRISNNLCKFLLEFFQHFIGIRFFVNGYWELKTENRLFEYQSNEDARNLHCTLQWIVLKIILYWIEVSIQKSQYRSRHICFWACSSFSKCIRGPNNLGVSGLMVGDLCSDFRIIGFRSMGTYCMFSTKSK